MVKQKKLNSDNGISQTGSDIIDEVFYGESSPKQRRIYDRWVLEIEYLFGNIANVVAKDNANVLISNKDKTTAGIAEKLGVAPSTVAQDFQNPDFKMLKRRILETQVRPVVADIALRNIIRDIAKGNVQTSKWYLENIDYFGRDETLAPKVNALILNLGSDLSQPDAKKAFTALKALDEILYSGQNGKN